MQQPNPGSISYTPGGAGTFGAYQMPMGLSDPTRGLGAIGYDPTQGIGAGELQESSMLGQQGSQMYSNYQGPGAPTFSQAYEQFKKSQSDQGGWGSSQNQNQS